MADNGSTRVKNIFLKRISVIQCNFPFSFAQNRTGFSFIVLRGQRIHLPDFQASPGEIACSLHLFSNSYLVGTSWQRTLVVRLLCGAG
jgi:hypothetical protein